MKNRDGSSFTTPAKEEPSLFVKQKGMGKLFKPILFLYFFLALLLCVPTYLPLHFIYYLALFLRTSVTTEAAAKSIT